MCSMISREEPNCRCMRGHLQQQLLESRAAAALLDVVVVAGTAWSSAPFPAGDGTASTSRIGTTSSTCWLLCTIINTWKLMPTQHTKLEL